MFENQTLLELDVSTNKIGVNGATSIAKALMRNEVLRKLDLACNDSSCTKIIFQVLMQNKSLRVLCIGNYFKNSPSSFSYDFGIGSFNMRCPQPNYNYDHNESCNIVSLIESMLNKNHHLNELYLNMKQDNFLIRAILKGLNENFALKKIYFENDRDHSWTKDYKIEEIIARNKKLLLNLLGLLATLIPITLLP